jgi:mannose-6-phosphate isomerase-like protein (cupin superfamily)
MDGIVSRSGEGETLDGPKHQVTVKATRPELDVLEFEVASDFEGPGLHVHKEHVDSFYVLEGELEFRMGDETVRAGPGTFVSAPPGTPHAFTNPGPNPARFLNIHSPDRGFVELMRAHDRGEKPDPQAFDIWYVDE